MSTDRWTGSIAPVYESTMPLLNRGHPSADLRHRFNMAKGYVLLLIVTINLMTDGTRSLADLAAAARIAGGGGTHPRQRLTGDGGKQCYSAWFMTEPRGN
jgi:hypothetical protein